MKAERFYLPCFTAMLVGAAIGFVAGYAYRDKWRIPSAPVRETVE